MKPIVREIVFRGRKKGGTEWFKGDLSYLVHDKRECYIFPPDGYNSPDWYEVDPATVGQYTGHRDRNGKKIFEGDILSDKIRAFSGKDGSPRYAERRYLVEWTYCGFELCALKAKKHSCRCLERCQIIGNRWDNPELLGEATP